jgi:hypothetical protein
VALAALAGCGDSSDKRLLNLAQQSLAQQARQSEQLAQQSQRIADTARQLVAADAKARQELLAGLTKLQQQIQAERAEFDRQRDALEQERRELAAQRGRDPIVANAIGAFGVVLACLMPLLLAGYVLYTVNRASPDEDAQAVSEVLIGEIVGPTTTLLPAPTAMSLLEAKPSGPNSPKRGSAA